MIAEIFFLIIYFNHYYMSEGINQDKGSMQKSAHPSFSEDGTNIPTWAPDGAIP